MAPVTMTDNCIVAKERGVLAQEKRNETELLVERDR